MSTAPPRFAAIDVGSNTILLTVAEYDGKSGLDIIEEDETQPRLASDLSATGLLSQEAMDQAVRDLSRMKDTCRRLGVDRIAAAATAAAREAANGAEFVERTRALGIPLRVISAEEEAALSFRSAAYRFPSTGRTLVADIGGGSLEIVGADEGLIKLSTSLPLGVVRLTEMGVSLERLRHHIRRVLGTGTAWGVWSGSRIIGSGGTFTSLAGLALAARGSGTERIHGTIIGAAEVEQLLRTLAAMTPAQRRQTPGLKPERADIIVAGLGVIAELLHGSSEAVTISGFGLRDGLLLEMVGC